jgi:DedD protein
MEKKKLLLVAISVGVFLVIVVGASLLIFAGNDPVAKGQDLPPVISSGVDPWTLRNIGQNMPLENTAEPRTPVRQDGGSPLSAKPENELQLFASEGDAPVKPAERAPVTITVPAPRAAAVPDTPRPQRSDSPAQARPAARSEAPRTVQPRPAPAPIAAAKPQAAPRSETRPVNNDYWIQTGAFSTQIRAEGAKESLADKGITSVIDNSNVNGRTWYRVRVGPYVSENEANYWLALVKSIDGFSNSQVRLSRR